MWGNSKDAHFSPSRDLIPQSTEKEFGQDKKPTCLDIFAD